MTVLFPDGITRLMDLPYTLFDAINMALDFLKYEELPEDERPPREIWLEPDLMREHVKAIKEIREEKYGLKSKDRSGGGTQNDAMKELFA